jgi:hypothetical protein
MKQTTKIYLGVILCISLTGCWNGENVHVDMGTVSIGQQLLDLQAAADAGAMSQEEYQVAREKILSLVHGCGEQSAEGDEEDA